MLSLRWRVSTLTINTNVQLWWGTVDTSINHGVFHKEPLAPRGQLCVGTRPHRWPGWFRISVKKGSFGWRGEGGWGGWAMEVDMSCINTKVVTTSLHIKYRLTSKAGHTTKLPRQRHHVFRSQCCWCIYYYSPWSAPMVFMTANN